MNIFHGTYCISYVRERFSCLYVYCGNIVNCVYYVQLALRLLWADFVDLCQMLYVCKKMSLCCLDVCKINVFPWWRHQMETFSASAALCAGNSPAPHKGQRRWALIFSLICAWTNGWVNNRDAVDLRRHCAHCDVIVMCLFIVGAITHARNSLLPQPKELCNVHWTSGDYLVICLLNLLIIETEWRIYVSV